MEEALNNDLTSLQVDKAKLESLDHQIENEKKVRSENGVRRWRWRYWSVITRMSIFSPFQGKVESEQKLLEAQAQIKSLQSKSKQVIHDLKAQVSFCQTTLFVGIKSKTRVIFESCWGK